MLYMSFIATMGIIFNSLPVWSMDSEMKAGNNKDKLFELLNKELSYNYKRFADSSFVPYYMNFRVNDVHVFHVSAGMGSLTRSSSDRRIYFVPQIRIGNEDLDNFIDLQNGAPSNMNNPPGAVFLPLNYSESIDGLKEIVRKELDSRYKFAVRAFEDARSRIALGNISKDTAGAFSKVPIIKDYSKPTDYLNYVEDKMEEWKSRVVLYSRLFMDNKDVVNSTVSVTYEMRRILFLSTEGTLIAENRPSIILNISAYGMADDGMTLPLNRNYFAFEFDDLPSDKELRNEIKSISAKVSELVNAPVVQPYTAPALLSGGAAGVFFHEIFGHRIEGQRLKNDNDGQTFKHMTGKSVLSELLSVYDDPSMSYFNGIPLYGHYKYDDQGVAGEKTVVVENGVLKNFLMTRTPINGHSFSNGHARADFVNDPTSRQANLIIESHENHTDDQMLKLLKEQIISEGKEFGFYFKEVTGGFTVTSSMSVNSFNVHPLEVYKVYGDERPNELVRGVDLIGTPLSMFSNIIRAGGTYEVFTGVCGASSGDIPVTSVAPSVLVSKVEVQSKPKSVSTPYLLDRIDYGEAFLGINDIAEDANLHENNIFEAMSLELERTMDINKKAGNLSGAIAPARVQFTLAEVSSANASVYNNGLVASRKSGPRRFSAVNLYVGDSLFSSDYSYTGKWVASPAAVPIWNDVIALRNAFRFNVDRAYKFAVDVYNSKQIGYSSASLPMVERDLPDFLPLQSIVNTMDESANNEYLACNDELDDERCSALGLKVAALLDKFPGLLNPRVSITEQTTVYYIVDNEGTRAKIPVTAANINISASAMGPKGLVWDFDNIFASSFNKLPSFEVISDKVNCFAERLLESTDAEVFDDYYLGPVLFEETSVTSIFLNNLLDKNGLFAHRKPIRVTSSVLSPENVSQFKDLRTLESRVGGRIMDTSLDIVNYTDEDYLKEDQLSRAGLKNGIEQLLGGYKIDVQGVRPPVEIDIVNSGVLCNVFSNRVPTVSSRQSKGSMRPGLSDNGPSAMLSPGILVVDVNANSGNEVLGRSELRKELLKRASEQGYEYAYIIRKYMGGSNQVVYKISVEDGSEVPVVGASVSPVLLNRMMNIGPRSFTNELFFENLMFGNTIPMSVILPNGVIFNDVEIQRQ